jgi:glycosyltransferase involved in cell wall biosynthesis
MNPKYTVIIPTKNRAYILWRAIQSVINQSYSDWELLVVDGGSTDGTNKLVNGFNDSRIKLIINDCDTGVASARNCGLKHARGKYIGYLDSDDFVLNNWLITINRHIDDNPLKVLYMPNKNFKIDLVDENNKLQQVFFESLLYEDKKFSSENIINLEIQCDTNGMIHSTDAIEKVGLWNTNLRLYEDYEFLLRFIEYYPNGLYYIPQVLVNYTRTYGKDSLCSKATYQDLIDCMKKVYGLHGNKKFMKKQTWYPRLIEKYRPRADEESTYGTTILDHLKEKYGR